MKIINERSGGRMTFPAVAFLLMALALFDATEARAQWTSGSGNTTTPDKVGVGTSNPANGKLEVTSDDGAASGEHSLLYGSRSGAGSAGFKLGYRADGASPTGGFIRGLGSFSFFLGTEGSPQALTIKNAGNVGVGTTSPRTRRPLRLTVRARPSVATGPPTGTGTRTGRALRRRRPSPLTARTTSRAEWRRRRRPTTRCIRRPTRRRDGRRGL